MPTNSTTAMASAFSPTIGDTVSELVAGLQRINARRSSRRENVQASAIAGQASAADGRQCGVSIPPLSAGFAYAAWLS